MIDFDLMMKAPAWYDMGAVQASWVLEGQAKGEPYPSLETRREVARAYLDALGKETVAQYSKTSVDDVVRAHTATRS